MVSSEKKLKNILIIKPSSLGDIVLALPALSALRRSFPDASITWLVRTEFAPLIRNHPDLTDIVLFDRKFLGKAWYNPRAFTALCAFIRRLRRAKFDTVIDLQGLFRTAAFAWLSCCKRRFGMSNAREFAHIFYTHQIPQNAECIHLVDYYLKIVHAAGASDIDARFILPNDPASAGSVNKLLASHDIASDNYAVFVPGSAHSDKCWPTERFAALADKLSQQFCLSIVATGSPAEKDNVDTLKAKANTRITNLAGTTNLNELVALLRNAKLVVSNDTGPGHIAAALGVPLVIIFSWSNPARIAPYQRHECMVAIEPYGRGLEIKSTNPRHNVNAVTFDQVYRTACQQLELQLSKPDEI